MHWTSIFTFYIQLMLDFSLSYDSQADSGFLKHNGILVCIDFFVGNRVDMQCNVDLAN